MENEPSSCLVCVFFFFLLMLLFCFVFVFFCGQARSWSGASYAAGDTFARRHIGPRDDEQRRMLQALGFPDMPSFIDAVVPQQVQRKTEKEKEKKKSFFFFFFFFFFDLFVKRFDSSSLFP